MNTLKGSVSSHKRYCRIEQHSSKTCSSPLLIVVCPLCLPELFSLIASPASFCICFGDSKRLKSPTSAKIPLPTPRRYLSFSALLLLVVLCVADSQAQYSIFHLFHLMAIIFPEHPEFCSAANAAFSAANRFYSSLIQALSPLHSDCT